jgi:hypothetical protein
LSIASNGVAIYVASECHEAEIRDILCASFGVVIEPSTSIDDENAWTLPTLRVIPGEEPCEGRILIAVSYWLGLHDFFYLFRILSLSHQRSKSSLVAQCRAIRTTHAMPPPANSRLAATA